MRKTLIKELMTPISEYTTVSEEEPLHNAILVLSDADKNFDPHQKLHRDILVCDANRRIVGKISQADVLRALEPLYKTLKKSGEKESASVRYGFSPDFLKEVEDQFTPLQENLRAMWQAIANKKVKEFMYTPGEEEYIRENDTLEDAIHIVVSGKHQALIVSDEKQTKIVGILRKADIFMAVCRRIKENFS